MWKERKSTLVDRKLVNCRSRINLYKNNGILFIVVLQTDQEGAETKISIFFIMYLYQALMLLSTVFDVAI